LKEKYLSEQEFLELYPQTALKIDWWKRYTDENGNDRVVKS